MRLHRLDLNRLIALDALLSELSVSRAADRLNLSQPAMSTALASLREHFEDPLLTPAGHTMRPTGFARELAEPVRQLVLQAQAIAQRRPAQDLSSLQQRLTLMASDATAAFMLAPVIHRAAAEAPLLSFDLRPVTAQLTQALDRGEIDLMVVAQAALSRRHPWEPLFVAPFACLVWQGHAACRGGISRADYLHARHVAVDWGQGKIELSDAAAWRGLEAERQVDVSVPTFSMIPDFLLGTRRVATVPRPLAEHLAQRWPLQVLDCPIPIEPLQGAIQWHPYKGNDRALLWLRQALHDRAHALGLNPAA